MTLDEAIKHAEKVAERERENAQVYDKLKNNNLYHPDKITCEQAAEKCKECAEEHRQLAEWLKELKNLREQTRWIPVSERLPEGADIVLLSLPPHIDPDGEECSASVICGHYIGGRDAEWGLSDGDTFGYGLVSVKKGTNPVAWMPLPEPYKASPTGAESEVQDAGCD